MVDATFLRLESLRVAIDLHAAMSAQPSGRIALDEITDLAKKCETFAWAGMQPLPYRDNTVKGLLVDLESSLRQEISGHPDENEIMDMFGALKGRLSSK